MLSASTVTNTIAYRAIALDFELWSTTSPAIQRAHLEHFSFLLRSSRYRRFNARVRLSKLEIVRKLLFALQSTWYPDETIPHVINAIVISMQGHFPAADVIKPVISYISAYIVVTGMWISYIASYFPEHVTQNLQSRHRPGHRVFSTATTAREHGNFWVRSYRFCGSQPRTRGSPSPYRFLVWSCCGLVLNRLPL